MSKGITSSSRTSSTSSSPSTSTTSSTQVPHEKIAMRAYEKWCKRGRPHGTDKKDWHEAEAELRQELSRPTGAVPQAQAAARR